MGGHQTRCLLHTVNCEGQKKKENDKIKERGPQLSMVLQWSL